MPSKKSSGKGKGNPYMGISKKDTIDLLVGAFEGGSNSWIEGSKITEYPNEVNELYMPSEKVTGKKYAGYTKLNQPIPVPKDKEEFVKFKKETGYHGIYDTLLNGENYKFVPPKSMNKENPIVKNFR